MLKHISLFVILLTTSYNLFAQDSMCACCMYGSFEYQQEYAEQFNPKLIKSKKIKKVLIYTHAQSADDTIESKKYRELKFQFDRNGRVAVKIVYNRKGKPHSSYTYKRNRYGNKYQETFRYIDSLEKVITRSSPKIIDYTYDRKNRLIKIKERDYKGKVIADAKSKFSTIAYDKKHRIIKVISYRNHHEEPSVGITTYTFSDATLSATYQSESNRILNASGIITYTKDWKPTLEKMYNERLKKDSFTIYSEYDTSGRLLKKQVTTRPDYISECPENGNYIDLYTYDENGFLASIRHTYNNITCEMIFEYIK